MKYNISIIYVYYNTPDEIKASLESVTLSAHKLDFEVIVIDNHSPISLPQKLPKHNLTVIKNKTNKGYGAGLNQGARIAKGKYLLMVNPDTLFAPYAIEKMFKRIIQDKKIGILGPQVLSADNTIARTISGPVKLPDAIFIFSFLSKIFPSHRFVKKFWLFNRNVYKEQSVTCIGGACLLIKKEVFDYVQGFDERFFMYFEEIDLSMRIKKAGYKNIYYPEAKVLHFEGLSTKNKKDIQNSFEESRCNFFKKYYSTTYAIFAEIFLRFSSRSLRFFSLFR